MSHWRRAEMGTNWVLFIFLASFFLSKSMHSLNLTCNPDDLRALEGFYESLESPIDGWGNKSSDCCTWEGLICESVSPNLSRVVSIELGSKTLRGTLSESLAGLAHLRTLNLSHNFFIRSLPLQLFHLEYLEVLDLSSNRFFGMLPMEKIHLPSLRYLDVSQNSLNGSINLGICKIAKQLQILDLSMNYFSGEVPATIGNCSLLEHLSLSSNLLNGNMPEDLFGLSKLSHLNLQNNGFSGTLSPSFGNLSNIVNFDISLNGFFGVLPDVFENLRKLTQFSANSNRFIGHLPASLSRSPSISWIHLRNNYFSGSIVLNCSLMVSLTSLDLGSNLFTGPILDNLSSCQQLITLNLAHNNLISQLPNGFKNFKSLSGLSLCNTNLHNLSAALEILQHCRNLTVLMLTANFNNEVMPADLDLQFNNLETLVIPNCGLTGLVPTWLRGCTKLQLLDLSWNRLSGTIPYWFSKLNFLFYLDLSNNSLSGGIPKSLTKLPSLTYGNFTSEDPSQDSTVLFFRGNLRVGRLQYNQIWSFPPSLDLSFNLLTGQIWPEFGNLKMLHVLHLKNNKLSGHIPTTFSNLINLEKLDLSYNSLSGTIPPSLRKLNFLSEFNVSFNQLSGRIPAGGQFDTFPDSSFEGNKGFCRSLSSACLGESQEDPGGDQMESPERERESIIDLSFAFGGVTGFIVVVTVCFASGWILPKEETRNRREINWNLM